MRIIYVTAMLPYGPMEAFVVPEIRELRRRGHSVLVVPTRPRGRMLHADSQDLSLGTMRQGLASPAVLVDALKEAAKAPGSVARVLGLISRSRNPRIFAKNALVVAKSLWLARIARSWRADHIHAHWASVSSTLAYLAAELTGVPWSVTAHRWDISENNLLGSKASSATFVRAISRRGEREIVDLVGARGNVRVVHMGVGLPAPRKDEPRRGVLEPLRVVVAANLREVKGHEYLLRAAAELASRGVAAHIDLAGDGPTRRRLEDEAGRLGLSRHVSFLGVVPHDQLVEGMRSGRWDVAVLPSVRMSESEQEGIPVFLIEAMSCGLPVISTRTGAIPELLENGAGLLVPDRDGEALATALERVAGDGALREALRRAGRERVETEFSIEAVVDSLERLMSAPPESVGPRR